MSFGNLDMNKLNEHEQQLQGQWYKPPDRGDNVFICPPWASGQPLNFYEAKVHWIKDHGMLMCPRTKGQQCPICEENFKLRERKSDVQAQALSKQIYAKQSFFYNVIPAVRVNNGVILYGGDPNKAPEIKPWNVSKQLHQIIVGFRGFYGNYCDPTNGVVIQLSRTQVMGNDNKPINKIVTNVNPNRGRLDDTLMALGETMPQLDQLVAIKPYDELKAIIDVKLATFGASTTVASAAIPNNAPINKNPLNPFGQPQNQPKPQTQAPQASVVIGGNQAPTPQGNPLQPATGNMHQLDSLDKLIAEQEAKKQEQGA